MADLNKGQGTIEKLDLERALWANQNVADWKIVTEQLINPIFKDNLEWLHKAALSGNVEIAAEHQQRFIESLIYAADGVRTLSSIVRSACTAAALPYRNGIQLFKQLIWKKLILSDIASVRLDPNLRCPRFRLPDFALTTRRVA